MDLTDSTRPVMLVWPRNGRPVIVANKIAAGLAQRDGWIEDIVLYEAYVDSPQEALAEVLRNVQLASGKVGFEKDNLSATHPEAVERALPRMKMGECTALMDRVRWIKTDEEVKRIRKAADLLDDAYLEAFSRIRPGDTLESARRPGGHLSARLQSHGSSTCSGTPCPTVARATW
jgi:Xaa-Pro aminopeptidase